MESTLRFIDVLFLACASRHPEEWIEPSYQIISLHAPDIANSFRVRSRRASTSQERATVLAAIVIQHFQYMERFFTLFVHPHPRHKFSRAIRDAELDAFGIVPHPVLYMEDMYNRSQNSHPRLVLAERLFMNRAFNIFMGGLTLIVAVRDNSIWLLHKILATRLRQPPGKALSKILWFIVRLSVILSRNAIFSTLLEYPHIANLITVEKWSELAIIACNRIPTRMHGGIYRFDEEISWTDIEYRTQEDITMAQYVLSKNIQIPLAAIEIAINSDNIDILRIFRLQYGQILMGICPSTLASFEMRIGANSSPSTVMLMADWYPLNPSRILWIATRMQRGPVIEKMLNSGTGVSSVLRHPGHIRHIAACNIRAGINSPQFSKIAYCLMEYYEIHANSNEFLFSVLWHLIEQEKLDQESDETILEHAFIQDISKILLRKKHVVMSEPCYPRSFMRFKTYEDIVIGNSIYYVDASAYYYDPESEHDRILVSELGYSKLKKRELRIQKLMERIILPARYHYIRNNKLYLPFKQELLAAYATRSWSFP